MDTPTASTFYGILKDKFPHTPTSKQDITLQLLAEFLLSGNKDQLFLLKGFAGTGKTTIVGDLVTNLLEDLAEIGFDGPYRAGCKSNV